MLDPSEKNFYFMASCDSLSQDAAKAMLSRRDLNIALFFIGKPESITPTEKAKAP